MLWPFWSATSERSRVARMAPVVIILWIVLLSSREAIEQRYAWRGLLSRVKPVSSNTASVRRRPAANGGSVSFSGNDVPRNPGATWSDCALSWHVIVRRGQHPGVIDWPAPGLALLPCQSLLDGLRRCGL